LIGGPDSDSWWDVPVSEVSELQSTQSAAATYEENKKAQRPYLTPSEGDS
jgi:3D-(3,5/4)-trihydroxycyclohexane-1,2-dione acylhydrolase (decyclizing)